MSNRHPEDELDALISALQADEQVPSLNTPEAELAAELVELAAQYRMNPAFMADLEAQLLRKSAPRSADPLDATMPHYVPATFDRQPTIDAPTVPIPVRKPLPVVWIGGLAAAAIMLLLAIGLAIIFVAQNDEEEPIDSGAAPPSASPTTVALLNPNACNMTAPAGTSVPLYSTQSRSSVTLGNLEPGEFQLVTSRTLDGWVTTYLRDDNGVTLAWLPADAVEFVGPCDRLTTPSPTYTPTLTAQAPPSSTLAPEIPTSTVIPQNIFVNRAEAMLVQGLVSPQFTQRVYRVEFSTDATGAYFTVQTNVELFCDTPNSVRMVIGDSIPTTFNDTNSRGCGQSAEIVVNDTMPNVPLRIFYAATTPTEAIYTLSFDPVTPLNGQPTLTPSPTLMGDSEPHSLAVNATDLAVYADSVSTPNDTQDQVMLLWEGASDQLFEIGVTCPADDTSGLTWTMPSLLPDITYNCDTAPVETELFPNTPIFITIEDGIVNYTVTVQPR